MSTPKAVWRAHASTLTDVRVRMARVHLAGTAREPELRLSSTPPQDEADILSLIVFNAPINSLGTDERVALAQRAGAIASGFVTAPLAGSIGRALDVDLFEIETTSEAAGFGAAVTLGQQLNEQGFVRFGQNFGPQDASEFILEYQLAEFLRFQGSVAPGGGVKANRVIMRGVERGAADLIFSSAIRPRSAALQGCSGRAEALRYERANAFPTAPPAPSHR